MTDPDNQDAAGLPQIITPLESGYIKSLLPMIVPILNQVLDATNLDVLLHITPLTMNSVWKGIQAALTVLSIVLVVVKRIKEGKNPNSTAPKIVLSKPNTVEEFAQAVKEAKEPAPAEPEILRVESEMPPRKKTAEELLDDYKHGRHEL